MPVQDLAKLAIEARTEHNLRHVSLLLCVALVKNRFAAPANLVGRTICAVIQRADELTEFVSLYWAHNPVDGKDASGRPNVAPLAKQVKKGLGLAFQKFDGYQLAKYDREKAVRLRDVLFLVHAKPKDEDQGKLWKALVDGTLPAPDTWEVALSGGKDKKETFERMLREGTLGYLALLRNLRNMVDAGVEPELIKSAILARKGGAERVLPFRYTAAARACPRMEPALDEALCEAIAASPILRGRTAVMVDVSGSMDDRLSAKSDLTKRRCRHACQYHPWRRSHVQLRRSGHGASAPSRHGGRGHHRSLAARRHTAVRRYRRDQSEGAV